MTDSVGWRASLFAAMVALVACERAAPAPVLVPNECVGTPCFTTRDGFRFVHPALTGVSLNAVHVAQNGDVWLAGDAATLIRIVPGAEPRYSRIAIPDVPTFADHVEEREPGASKSMPGVELDKLPFGRLLVNSLSDIWVTASNGDLLHSDGARWQRYPHLAGLGGHYALAAGADGRLWMAGTSIAEGGDPTPAIFNPKTRTFAKGPAVDARWFSHAIARQGDDMWIAGEGGLSRSQRGGPFALAPVAKPGTAEPWVTAMSLDPTGATGYAITSGEIWERKADRFAPWTSIDTGALADVFAFPGRGPVWFVGSSVWRRAQGAAKLERVAVANASLRDDERPLDYLHAVHGRAPDDVWIAGSAGAVLHYDGRALRDVLPRFANGEVVGVAWVDTTSWIAATEDGKLLEGTLDGVTRHQVLPMVDGDAQPMQLTTLRTGEVVIATCRDGIFLLEREGRWTSLPAPQGCVHAVHGLDRAHLWVAATREGTSKLDAKHSVLWQRRGDAWVAHDLGLGDDDASALHALAVGPDGAAWVAAHHAILRVTAGGALARVATHASDDYDSIAIRAADDIWFATDARAPLHAGALLHWNGASLERLDNLASAAQHAVATPPDGSVWSFGGAGIALHSTDGKTFRRLYLELSRPIIAVAARADGALVLGDETGNILVRAPR